MEPGHDQYDEQANIGGNSDQSMGMNQQQGFGGGGFDPNMAGFHNGNFANMGMNGFNPMMGMMGMGMPNMMGKPSFSLSSPPFGNGSSSD